MFLSLSEGKNPIYRLVHPNNYDDDDDYDGDGGGGGGDDDYNDDQDTQRKTTSTMQKIQCHHIKLFSLYFFLLSPDFHLPQQAVYGPICP